MHPIIRLGDFELSTYALVLSLGAALGFWLTYRESERKGLDTDAVLRLTALAFVAGLVGARALAWLSVPETRADRPLWSVLALWDRSGMSLYGGVGLGALVGALYGRVRGLDLADVSDTLAYAFVPAVVLVRVGCFLNGCCYGKPTELPWGLVAGGAPNHVNFGIPSHPTQLYEAGAALLLFAALRRMRWKRRFVGQLSVVAGIVYPLFRWINEAFRGDPRPEWAIGDLGLLSLTQILSVAAIAIAIGAALALERR